MKKIALSWFTWAFAFAAILCPIYADSDSSDYNEEFRPQFHFTPEKNWMNDPNGLVYYDGEYHLFFQHNPYGNRWGHMSWGHAVSTDLVHWEELPVAIPEQDGVMAFSGSAVIDWDNTSGLGSEDNPPMVALYTGWKELPDRLQAQYLAYSLDKGRTWEVYDGNPVLDLYSQDFRDPKVIWHEESEKWVMVVSLATEHNLVLFGSADLIHWEHLSNFGPHGARGGYWECPDLFELPVVGKEGETKWVLQSDLNPGSIAGGSGGQYFVGEFDGTRFIPDRDEDGEVPIKWVDYGQDFFASQSWADVPESDGRRLYIGWLNNWLYAQEIPTDPWRSAQSVVRELELHWIEGEYLMIQKPAVELETLRADHKSLESLKINSDVHSLANEGISGELLELYLTLNPGTAQRSGIVVRANDLYHTVIGYDREKKAIFVDRSRSGTWSHEEFASYFEAPLIVPSETVNLRVLVDRSSVEVFAMDGTLVLSCRIFPDDSADGVSVFAEGGEAEILTLDAWKLSSIWGSDQP